VAEFTVFALVVQDMPDDHDEGVSDGDGGLRTRDELVHPGSGVSGWARSV
jgi:hypothetical protein